MSFARICSRLIRHIPELYRRSCVMSAKSVCDMSCGKMHEFALALDKAGFNADLVQKVVNSRGNKLAKAMYVVINSGGEIVPAEKFSLLADLGIITVPDDYDHTTRLTLFGEKNREKFYYYNDGITDEHFPNPTRILKPGDKLHVRAFKQIVSGATTSEERLAFLATQKAVHTGAQGASLVWEQKRDQLPKGYWYSSFDEKDRLWEDADGDHRVPLVGARSGGDFDFRLGDFEYVWYDDRAFLRFCDVE